jgi:hypothetical protein
VCRLTDRSIVFPIPHIVDRAASSAHHYCPSTEQGEVEERCGGREVIQRRGHRDGPGW